MGQTTGMDAKRGAAVEGYVHIAKLWLPKNSIDIPNALATNASHPIAFKELDFMLYFFCIKSLIIWNPAIETPQPTIIAKGTSFQI